jgi:hypothetical protein
MLDVSVGLQDYLYPFTLNLNAVLNPSNIFVHPFGGAIGKNPSTGKLISVGDWQDAGLSDVSPYMSSGQFGTAFAQATNRARIVHFNLEGIRGGYIDFANRSTGDFYVAEVPYTATELYLIRQNPSLCRKTVFYEHGSVFPPVPSGEAYAQICGA